MDESGPGAREIRTRMAYFRDEEGHVVASVQNGCLLLPSRRDRTRYVAFTLTEVARLMAETGRQGVE